MMANVFRLLAMILWVILPASAMAKGKVALVVGNSEYDHATTLANPQNDARAIANKLEALGFSVMLHENLGGQEMRVALGAFTEEALFADVALVYYAGHGIEMGGQNYLVPTDAKMRSEATAKFEALALNDVIASVNQSRKLGMVLLDACRDNPFASAMKRNNGTRSMSRGLAPISVEGEQGLLISFAAQEGNTADDGDGSHSPYTTALLDVIDEPGLEVGRMFRKVRAQVRDATGGRQVPIERMQLPDEAIYFVPQGETPTPKPPQPTPVVKPVAPVETDPMVAYLNAVQSGEIQQLSDFISRYPDHPLTADARKLVTVMQDDAFWESIKKQNTVQAYRRYLLAFSNGQYAEEAAAKIAMLTKPVTPTPPVVAPPVVSPPVVTPPTNTVRPSFDCAKAGNVIEYAICGDANLARQDNQLAAAYKSARSRGVVSATQQRQWIKERNVACEKQGSALNYCLDQIGATRIQALNSGRLTGNVAPSFNCGRASTTVERALCNSDVLGWQDHQLLRIYQQAKSNGWHEADGQRAWIRQRESACARLGSGVALCVARYNADRILVLARR